MKRNKIFLRKWGVVFFLGALFFLNAPPQKGVCGGSSESESESIYDFSEHLLDAQAYLSPEVDKDHKESGKIPDPVEGRLVKEGYYFKDFDPSTAVKIIYRTVNAESRKCVMFNPVEDYARRLFFKEVPPGSRLVLDYYVNQDAKNIKPHYLYLSVWVGAHEMTRLRIPTLTRGWKKEVLELGVVSFLNASVPVTFGLASDVDKSGPGQVEFSFSARIEQ